ncbi:MAG: hypothetical protein ACXWT0_00360 [Methylobacter sp.]
MTDKDAKKRVVIGKRPTAIKPVPENADDWVDKREVVEEEGIKRLTIDIPESLHREIKAQCAMRGAKIADEVRVLLMQKYGKQEMQK